MTKVLVSLYYMDLANLPRDIDMQYLFLLGQSKPGMVNILFTY